MNTTTDSPLYRKAFEHYLRKGIPPDVSMKAMAETTAHHTTLFYIWHTQEDDRVRPTHAANDHGFFAWNLPPATGNPGDAYGCRCWAEPVTQLSQVPLRYRAGVVAAIAVGLIALSPAGRAAIGTAARIATRATTRTAAELAALRRIFAPAEVAVKPPAPIETPLEILNPNGEPIGESGMRPEVRVVKGDETDAEELFKKLTEGGTPEQRAGYPGKGVKLPNGDWIGYREASESKSGSPTIDLDVKGIDFDKIHYY